MARTRPYCVGLTGGIGSGKSLAARHFAELGAAVIDTDVIAHALTGAGGLAMPALVEAFGAEVAAADGSLDRVRMRERVFADAAARTQLEAILHPLIRARAQAALAACAAPYAILVVPLLLETGAAYRPLVDRILVVDCEPAQQVERAAARPGMDEDAVRRVMAAQVGRAQRLAAADDVIDNRGTTAGLVACIRDLHGRYLALAGAAK